MARRSPALSVIICHHVGDLILQCLAAIQKQQGVTFETYVVTSDPHRTFDGVTTIHSTAGPAEKRNLAAARCTTPYLVFLDDDILDMREDCLKQLWWGMEKRPQAGMAYAKILNAERRDEFDDCGSWLTWTGFLFSRAGNGQRDTGQFDCPTPILSSKSATCIVRRSDFECVQGFDSSYYILGEESDLAWRLWLQNKEVWYLPRSVSWHAFNTRFKPMEKHYNLERIHYRGCKNYLSCLLTNLGTASCWRVLPVHVAGWGLAAIGFALSGQVTRAWYIGKALCYHAVHLRRTLAKRRVVQSRRVISDRELMPIIMRHPPLRYYTDRMRRYLTQGIHG